MEKPLKFEQLFMPKLNTDNVNVDFEKKLQPQMSFEPESLEHLYVRHKDELIENAIRECEQYLDDETWMEEDAFPCVKELTGVWYLASVHMFESNGKIRVSLYIHFLGHYPKGYTREEIDDYLGMEAWFDYDQAGDVFIFDCFDTDSI